MELKDHIFFSFFEENIAKKLLAEVAAQVYKEGTLLFKENDVADDIYLIMSGSVKITKKDPLGHEQVIAIIHEGDYFGEFAVFDGKPRSGSAIVGQDGTTLARIPGDYVLTGTKESGKYAESRLTHNIIRRVRENNQRVVEERVLKERKAIIGEMASAIIHDLKNPFGVIQLAIDLIKIEPLSPHQEEGCSIIKMQVNRSMEMVNEILEFAKGAPKLKKQDVNVKKIFEDIQILNKPTLITKKIAFEIKSEEITANIDGVKMMRVFQNLVGNAAEVLSEDGGKIVIEAFIDQKDLCVTVTDNGPGIPLKMQPTIFEVFSTMGKKTGTGLGMAITKSIVDAHGGTISFETSPDWGTKFLVKIPLG